MPERKHRGKAAQLESIPPTPVLQLGGWKWDLLAAMVVLLAGVFAYHGTLHVPFLFDDDGSIRNNPSIRSLGTWWQPPGNGETVSGRPLLNLSFAVNFAFHGLAVEGYHLVNLAIHLTAGLVLFFIVQWTLDLSGFMQNQAGEARGAAFFVALIWTLHPLQTESVTYVVQRAESLAGLLYLLAMLCFIRATRLGARPFWSGGAWLCCLLGMAAKEIVVTLPVMLVLYDRTFLTRSWGEMWKSRGRFHLQLAATWLVLALLVWTTGGRGGTAGLGSASSFDYAITQVWAVVHYLRLSYWPDPLVFDYGRGLIMNPAKVALSAAVLLPLIAVTAWGIWRYRPLAFCGVFFFVLLAPSSSFVPVATQTMAEHRMYLPLAAVVVLSVTLLQGWIGRISWVPLSVVALALATLTVQRNRDYQSSESIWADSISKWPYGARARSNLAGLLYKDPARRDEALRLVEEAVKISPMDPVIQCNRSLILSESNRLDEAIVVAEQAVALGPDLALVHATLGAALLKSGDRLPAAEFHLRRALTINPAYATAYATLGQMLANNSNTQLEGMRCLREAVRLDPTDAESHAILGMALLAQTEGQAEAVHELEAAHRLMPGNPGICTNLAFALASQPGRGNEAARLFGSVAQAQPQQPDARYNYGTALLHWPGREADAIKEFEVVVGLKPDDAEAHNNLGLLLSGVPARAEEAREHLQTALRLKPDLAEAHFNLAKLLAADAKGQNEAIQHLEMAMKLSPSHEAARKLLVELKGRPGI